MTWFTWTQQWIELKWPHWAGTTRRTAVETLAAITPRMVKPKAPPPPADLVDWLRTDGYIPGSERWAEVPAWLDRWSVPLDEITPHLLERVLTEITTRQDGKAMTAAVSRRRRNTLGAVLRAAVKRDLLASNPLDKAEWRTPERDMTIDVSTVPSITDVLAIVDHVAALDTEAARYSALFACVGLAGLRPSEAIGLVVGDLDLPSSGWGLAHVRGATTEPGARFTSDGSPTERKGLKHRAAGPTSPSPAPAPRPRSTSSPTTSTTPSRPSPTTGHARTRSGGSSTTTPTPPTPIANPGPPATRSAEPASRLNSTLFGTSPARASNAGSTLKRALPRSRLTAMTYEPAPAAGPKHQPDAPVDASPQPGRRTQMPPSGPRTPSCPAVNRRRLDGRSSDSVNRSAQPSPPGNDTALHTSRHSRRRSASSTTSCTPSQPRWTSSSDKKCSDTESPISSTNSNPTARSTAATHSAGIARIGGPTSRTRTGSMSRHKRNDTAIRGRSAPALWDADLRPTVPPTRRFRAADSPARAER